MSRIDPLSPSCKNLLFFLITQSKINFVNCKYHTYLIIFISNANNLKLQLFIAFIQKVLTFQFGLVTIIVLSLFKDGHRHASLLITSFHKSSTAYT